VELSITRAIKFVIERRPSRFSSPAKPQNGEARAGRQVRIADYLRKDFTVLDELGYLPFAQAGGQLLFHLVSQLPPARVVTGCGAHMQSRSVAYLDGLAIGWPMARPDGSGVVRRD
jgi:hypothetical protein